MSLKFLPSSVAFKVFLSISCSVSDKQALSRLTEEEGRHQCSQLSSETWDILTLYTNRVHICAEKILGYQIPSLINICRKCHLYFLQKVISANIIISIEIKQKYISSIKSTILKTIHLYGTVVHQSKYNWTYTVNLRYNINSKYFW